MKINSITEGKSKQVKASEKKPKLNKPNLGHESPHPMQGRMVGESELDNMDLQDRMLANDLHSMMKDIGPEKFIGFLFGAMTNPKYKNLPLEKFADQIKNIYTQSREPFTYTSQDTPGGIDKGMRRLAVNKDGKLDYTEGKTKRQNPVAKHSKNMPGAGAHKSAKDYDRKKAKLDLKKELQEGGYSASKSALVKAVLNDLEKKALSDDADNLTFLNKLARMIGKKVYKRENGSLVMEKPIPFTQCPKCKGSIVHETQLNEKQDACYHKVKSRYKVWPSAYASGALVKCRKVGAKNWGNSSKKKKKKSKK